MKYFYSAAVMGYGKGRFWHRFYNFPNFERVSKTVTLLPKLGIPFAVFKYKDSVYNRVSLHNPGLSQWLRHMLAYDETKLVVSIAGDIEEVCKMVYYLVNFIKLDFAGIEINFSCPNAETGKFTSLPDTKHIPLYLKLRYNADPSKYDLDKVKGIRLNSVPHKFGGVSGKLAQEKNWSFIKHHGKDINVAGCSFLTKDDILRLEDMGCTEIGIGSTILINPKLIESL